MLALVGEEAREVLPEVVAVDHDRPRLRRLFLALGVLGIARDDSERLSVRRPGEVRDAARESSERFRLARIGRHHPHLCFGVVIAAVREEGDALAVRAVSRLVFIGVGRARQRVPGAAVPARAPEVVARRVGLEVRLADAVDDVLAVRREVEVFQARDAHEVVDAELRGFGGFGAEREGRAGDEAGKQVRHSHRQFVPGFAASARYFSRAALR